MNVVIVYEIEFMESQQIALSCDRGSTTGTSHSRLYDRVYDDVVLYYRSTLCLKHTTFVKNTDECHRVKVDAQLDNIHTCQKESAFHI